MTLTICLPSDPDATILTSYVLPLHLFASADVVKRPLTLLGDEEYFQLATDKWSNRVIAFTLEFQKAWLHRSGACEEEEVARNVHGVFDWGLPHLRSYIFSIRTFDSLSPRSESRKISPESVLEARWDYDALFAPDQCFSLTANFRYFVL